MPTALKRVMVSLPKDLEEKLTTVAKAERRPLASMCVALIEAALKMPRYRDILHSEPEPDDVVIKEMGVDKLTPERLKELQQVLGMLEKLKS